MPINAAEYINPEIDNAVNPSIFGFHHGESRTQNMMHMLTMGQVQSQTPIQIMKLDVS